MNYLRDLFTGDSSRSDATLARHHHKKGGVKGAVKNFKKHGKGKMHGKHAKHDKTVKHDKHEKQVKQPKHAKQMNKHGKGFEKSHERQEYGEQSLSLLHKKYQIGKEVGRGSDGIVKLCKVRKSWQNNNLSASNRLEHEVRAVKVIDKTKVSASHLKDIYNEMSILHQLSERGHENILQCFETLDSKKNIYIITELLTGDTLWSRMTKQGHFEEIEIAILFYQLLEALAYFHDLNIVHRDLKPENIMFRKGGENSLVVIDFGLAGLLTKHNNYKLKHPCGTPFYVAPEVIDPRNKTHEYDSKADMWSCGVILYALCAAKLPFDLKQNEPLHVLYKQILSEKIQSHMMTQAWAQRSHKLKDLVLSLMTRDPSRRLSAKEALDHPWFAQVFANYVRRT